MGIFSPERHDVEVRLEIVGHGVVRGRIAGWFPVIAREP